MRKLIASVILLAFLAGSAAADTVYVMCQPDSFVYARTNPKMTAEVAGFLELGDALETDGVKRNGFVKVYAFEPMEVWVYAGYLAKSPVTVETVKTQIQSKGRVRCRRYINGTVRKWLKNGSEVTIYAFCDDWAITNQGFIKTQFLGVFCDEQTTGQGYAVQ